MSKEQSIYGSKVNGDTRSSNHVEASEYGLVTSPSYHYTEGATYGKRIDHQPLVNYELNSDVSFKFIHFYFLFLDQSTCLLAKIQFT